MSSNTNWQYYQQNQAPTQPPIFNFSSGNNQTPHTSYQQFSQSNDINYQQQNFQQQHSQYQVPYSQQQGHAYFPQQASYPQHQTFFQHKVQNQAPNIQLTDSGVVHPSLYMKNGKVVWAAVNHDSPLEIYPEITKEILKESFPEMSQFFDSHNIHMYTFKEIKSQSFKQASNPAKTSSNEKFNENFQKATIDKTIDAAVDNRKDKLHPITFTHAPFRPAQELMDERRQLGINPKPMNAYDLTHIKYSGKLSNSTWEKLHDLGHKDLKLNSFFIKDEIINVIDKSIRISREDKNSLSIEEHTTIKDFDSVAQVKTALLVLIECQQAIFPYNKSSVVLNMFITSKSDFQIDVETKLGIKSELAQARLIERFVDTILHENAIAYETNQPYLDLDKLEVKYATILQRMEIFTLLTNAREEERKKQVYHNNQKNLFTSPARPGQNRSSTSSSTVPLSPKDKFKNSMCKEYNQLGKCPRMNTYDQATNQCSISRPGAPPLKLKHICSFNKSNNRFCTMTHSEITHHKPKTN